MIPVCEPFLNGNELAYITEAVRTGWISSSGKYVKEFEEKFAAYCGAAHGIGTCNGTTALHLALVCLGIGPGDEVIVPDFTMIASAFAVCYTGARPVFVDADRDTWNIDVTKLEQKITKNTKAIMPVHIFGMPCDMAAINGLARSRGIKVLEDAAEAHGAEYNGIKTGSLSDIAAFSFFANKNLTTGEGGMVVTNDAELNARARYFKNLCFPPDAPRDYLHNDIGFNYRLSNLHAAIGIAQTEKADEYRAIRIRNGKLYQKLLKDVPGIAFQKEQPGSLNVHWMNGLTIDPAVFGMNRDALMAHVHAAGIETRKFFNGMHRQRALEKYGCDCSGKYPVSDMLADNGFYLPSGSTLTAEQIQFICDTILKAKKK